MLTLRSIKIDKANIDWNGLPKRFMNRGELETLVTLVSNVHPITVMEIGINVGRTAKCLLREVHSIKHYIGVDVYAGYEFEKSVQAGEIPEQAAEMVIGDPRVQLLISERGSFDLTPENFPLVDVVFIDGDHSWKGLENDTLLAREIVRPGGLIIWHDYHDLGTVDVRDFLHDQVSKGHDIRHIRGTWLAFEVV